MVKMFKDIAENEANNLLLDVLAILLRYMQISLYTIYYIVYTMKKKRIPGPIIGAAYLTDTVPVGKELLSGSNLEFDEELGTTVTVSDLVEKEKRADPKEYILISRDNIKDLLLRLSGNDQYMAAQEIIEILDSGILDDSAKKVNKSIRVSRDAFLCAVKKAYQEDLSLSNAVKQMLRDEIYRFIDHINENHVPIDGGRLKFISEELDSWVNQTKPRNQYHIYSKYSASCSEEKQEMADVEYLLVKEHFRNEFRERLDREVFEESIEDILNILDVKNQMAEVDLLFNLEEYTELLIYPSGEDVVLGFDYLLQFFYSCENESEFYRLFDGLEHSEPIQKACKDIFEGIGSTMEKDGNGEIGIWWLIRPLLCNLNYILNFNDRGEVVLEGVPLNDKDFEEKFALALNEKWEKITGKGQTDPDTLKRKHQEYINDGDWKRAKEVNEFLVIAEKVEDFHKLIARFVSSLSSEVISVRGIENIITLVDAVTYDKTLDDIIKGW